MKTQSVMAAHGSSTGWAAPFFFLCSQKWFHPILLERREIFKKTHPEKSPISCINLFEGLTGIVGAFITKLDAVLRQPFASFFQKRAFLLPRPAPDTARETNTLAFHIVYDRKVPAADVTVHPTRSDKVLRKSFPHVAYHEMR